MLRKIVGVTLISFLIIKLAPGDFLDQLKLNPQISPETIERLRKIYGLDQPVLIQYLKWLKSAVFFDLGYSFQYHAPVTELIAERVPNTLLLSVSSALISWTLAIPLGMIAAFNEGRKIDRLIQAYAYSFMSVPSFFLAFSMFCITSSYPQ